MKNKLAETIYNWLLLMDVKSNIPYLEHRLLSHPDYPSAFSITSLLTELGIENSAVEMQEDQLQEITEPFLAFIDDSDFILIDDVTQADKRCKNFSSRWSGIVIMAEKPQKIIETKEMLAFKEKHSLLVLKKSLALFSLFLLVSIAALNISSISEGIFFFISVTGLAISGGIVLHELGIENQVFTKLCGVGTQHGCEAVSNSKAATPIPGIKLSDVGLSFFSGTLSLLTLKAITPGNLTGTINFFLGWITLLSIPFVIFSLYYQWKVVQKWCVACLLVVSCLVAMQAIQLREEIFKAPASAYQFSLTALLFSIPGFTWIWIRQVLDRKKELGKSELRLLQIYRSTEVFEAYLKKQKSIDAKPWPVDFQIGNPNAACQILMVSAPYCGPCAEAHKTIQQVLDKYKEKVGIIVRFLVNVHDEKNLNTAVQEYMLRYAFSIPDFFQYPSKVEKMIGDWYRVRDLTEFKALYPVDSTINVWSFLEEHSAWVKNADIHFTPEFYINGYKLENPYKPKDLIEFAGNLSELFTQEEIVEEEYMG